MTLYNDSDVENSHYKFNVFKFIKCNKNGRKMNVIKYDTSYWKFPELKFLIIFLMTLFPGEEDYGAHCW